ncbi:MAG TPA: PfkB family carbohydrate kinase [Mucilaginibacter sp.]|nr:PfkB family carbohydrate kinase [Mucilaginibacter sp.]
MHDLCCIGHITSDKVVTAQNTSHMPGGTAYYFSKALSKIDIDYLLATSVAPAEDHYVNALRKEGIDVNLRPSTHTVIFENIYAENQDERTQNVLATADPFQLAQIESLEAKVFHLGPLLPDDFSVEVIKALKKKGIVSVDIQGFLRKVENNKVYPTDWPEKREALQYVDVLKADVAELKALTGLPTVEAGLKLLADWGLKEVVITNASKGSVIYRDRIFYKIPAYPPRTLIDATGCGDTYMAAYLYRRIKGYDLEPSGKFAAAMASLKMETSGPFSGTEQDVTDFLNAS